jgi:hypothetical protein
MKLSILFFLNRKATPSTLDFTVASLCAIIFSRLSFGLPISTPKALHAMCWRGHRLPTHDRIEHQALGIFQAFLDPDQEGHGFLAVDDPVVVGKRQIHHRPDHHLAADAIGRSWILCMPRMPDCGEFRIGEDISEP